MTFDTRKSMKRTLTFAVPVILAGAVIAAWLHFRVDKLVIPDASKRAVLKLRKKSTQRYIHSLELKISGTIDGSAAILVAADGETLHRAQLEGSEGMYWTGDCYSDEVEVQYSPTGVTTGRLQIDYSFRD
jgi:hypothetical protein